MALALIHASPAALASGNTNDYTGIGTASVGRLSADVAGSTLTGIVAPADPTYLVIVNISANTLTITHQDTNSTAANRFLTATGASLTLTQDDTATFWYDLTTQRWRQLTSVA